ncbi:MAG: transposase [Gemmataceae bacterium]|nr:transposase [Gemmataceae bacterium]
MVEQTVPKGDPDPKARSCDGLSRADTGGMMLRFVSGRPVSQVTEDDLAWVCERLGEEGKKALLLVWDNAAWHVGKRVRAWIKAHNRTARAEGGVRIVACFLPVKSPWLNLIEPKWAHGKRAVVEPERRLAAAEVRTRPGCGPAPRPTGRRCRPLFFAPAAHGWARTQLRSTLSHAVPSSRRAAGPAARRRSGTTGCTAARGRSACRSGSAGRPTRSRSWPGTGWHRRTAGCPSRPRRAVRADRGVGP